MGQVERAKENKKDSRRDKARESRGRRNQAAGNVSLRSVDWRITAALLVAFAEEGGAIRLGYTRDGGAFALGCYLGDDYATEYIRPSEDYASAIQEIAEAWLENVGMTYHQALQEFMRPEEK